jgi:hypothetical protein
VPSDSREVHTSRPPSTSILASLGQLPEYSACHPAHELAANAPLLDGVDNLQQPGQQVKERETNRREVIQIKIWPAAGLALAKAR